jgi:chromosome segregation ATPase
MQHELDVARDASETARRHADGAGRQAEEEVGQWRDRSEGLEDEIRRLEEEKAALEDAAVRGSEGNVSRMTIPCRFWLMIPKSDQAASQLKYELHSLVEELTALSIRNDDLIAARESDAQAVNEMEARVEEYRRKYEAVRIELRNLKGKNILRDSSVNTDSICSYIHHVYQQTYE